MTLNIDINVQKIKQNEFSKTLNLAYRFLLRKKKRKKNLFLLDNFVD